MKERDEDGAGELLPAGTGLLTRTIPGIRVGSDGRIHRKTCPGLVAAQPAAGNDVLAASTSGDTCPRCDALDWASSVHEDLHTLIHLHWAALSAQRTPTPSDLLEAKRLLTQQEAEERKLRASVVTPEIESVHAHVLDLVTAKARNVRAHLRTGAARSDLLNRLQAGDDRTQAVTAVTGYRSVLVANQLWTTSAIAWGTWDKERRNLVIAGPGRAVQWLRDHPLPRSAGKLQDPVHLPGGNDPDQVAEIVAGIWDPDGDGALRDLRDAVQAAAALAEQG